MKAYFSHDEGARNDPKLVKVLMRLGQAGKGVYWDLVEMLYEQGGYLPLAECESYAFALRTECDLILKLVNDFGLFASDGERFWSETALDRIQMRNAKTEARAAAGAKGGKARAEREAAAKALLEQELSERQALLENNEALLNDFQAIKGNEIKGNKSKESSSLRSEPAADAATLPEKKIAPEPLLLKADAPNDASPTRGAADVPTRKARPHAYDPADIRPGLVLPFDTDAFREAWAGYKQFREEQGHPRYSGGMMEQEALRSLGNLAGGDEARALAIISQTVRKGWKDLFKLDEPRAQHPQQHAVGPEKGQKPDYSSTVSAGALAQRRWEQRYGGAGDSGPAAGAYPGAGPAEPAGVRAIG